MRRIGRRTDVRSDGMRVGFVRGSRSWHRRPTSLESQGPLVGEMTRLSTRASIAYYY